MEPRINRMRKFRTSQDGDSCSIWRINMIRNSTIRYFFAGLILFSGLILATVFLAQEHQRIYICRLELRDIAIAASNYQGLRIDGMLPSSPSDLIQDVTIRKEDSLDGMAYGSFFEATGREDRLKNGKFLDPWGNEYWITDGTVISSGGIGGSMKYKIPVLVKPND